MPTTFLLIRHGATGHLQRILSGRAPHIALNEKGWRQAETLAHLLAATPLDEIRTSPILRARETAAIVAKPHNLAPLEDPALLETNWGDWTLHTFAALNQDPAWLRFNQHRDIATPPGGESFSQVASRVTQYLESLSRQYPHHTLALITHADPIKAAVLHYSRQPLSAIQNLTIDPATYSAIVFPHTSPPRVLCSNNRQTEPRMLPTYVE